MAATCLQEWLVDPLFQSAEEVQDSADRLESNYRTWLQELGGQTKARSCQDAETQRLRLMSSCDTLRWQLEVFERAIKSDRVSTGNAAMDAAIKRRRQNFVNIIRQQLQSIEVQVRGMTSEAVSTRTQHSSHTQNSAVLGAVRATTEASASHHQSVTKTQTLLQHEERLSSFLAHDGPIILETASQASASLASSAHEVTSPSARSDLSGFFCTSWSGSPRSNEGSVRHTDADIFSGTSNGGGDSDNSGPLSMIAAGAAVVVKINAPKNGISEGAQNIQTPVRGPSQPSIWEPLSVNDGDQDSDEKVAVSRLAAHPRHASMPAPRAHASQSALTVPIVEMPMPTRGGPRRQVEEGSEPQGKTFPSLVSRGGAMGIPGMESVQGWQCLLVWVQHLRKTTRHQRRRLTDSSGFNGSDGFYGSQRQAEERRASRGRNAGRSFDEQRSDDCYVSDGP